MSLAGRRVTLVALNQLFSVFTNLSWVPFSYATWKLQAALLSPPVDGVEVSMYAPGTVDPEEIAEHVLATEPDVVGFSVYLWSFTAFAAAMAIIKRRRPEVTVLFGGPSARPAMFDLPEFRAVRHLVDAVCVDEGESALRMVVQLADRSPAALRAVPGLALPEPEGWFKTAPRELPPLDSLPSAYQLGLVGPELGANLETYRGCPLSCSFCEWGVMNSPKRLWSAEYLVRELEAMRKAQATSVYLIDAGLNLNRAAFRNLVAAESQVRFLRDVPVALEIYATAVNEADVEFLSSIMVARIGVGLQTFNVDVNRILQRPYDERRFLRGVELLSAIPNTSIELILGLPYDDPASFKETVRRAMELDATAVHVFHSLVLPDGLMTRAPAGSDLRFDPHTLKTISARGWSERDLAETMEWLRRQCDALGGTYDTTMWRLPARGLARQRLDPSRPERVLGMPGPERRPSDEGHARPESRRSLPVLTSSSPSSGAAPLELQAQHALGEAVQGVSGQRWKLIEARRTPAGRLQVDCAVRSGLFQFELWRAERGVRCFRWVDGIAVSHTTSTSALDAGEAAALEGAAYALAGAARALPGDDRW